ncbi:MAG: hypothetical protein Q8P24_21770 [Desulfobacterales bacterium]|nr:hypothetical protein [Desulfobacterales bacterium]
MSQKTAYQCEVCGRNAAHENPGKKPPVCCSQPMKTLEALAPCNISATAEHARFDDPDEPCDDGRSGKL